MLSIRFSLQNLPKKSYFLALLSSSNVNVAAVEADKHAAEETERGELYSPITFFTYHSGNFCTKN